MLWELMSKSLIVARVPMSYHHEGIACRRELEESLLFSGVLHISTKWNKSNTKVYSYNKKLVTYLLRLN